MRWLAAAWTVAVRELGATVRSPIAWIVAAAFLALEGVTFSATVRVLADPTRPGDYGAVLRGQFAASLLGWLVVFAVVAAVTMRLIAEERRQGTWETLVTAPVAEGTVLLGKWLAAWIFLVALWLPTLAYPAIVAAFAPPGVALDLGPLGSAYLGVVLVLAAASAIGLWASALTQNQVIASVLGFGALVALLLVGELDEMAAGELAPGSTLGGVIAALDLRRRMDDLARGAIDRGTIVLFVGLTAAALGWAHVAAALGRWRAARGGRRALFAAVVTLDVVLALAWVARHDARWDVSRDDVNQLGLASRELVASLDRPLELTVVRPALTAFEPVYVEVDRLIARMVAESGRIERRDIDARADAAAVAVLADEFGVPPRDLADGGGVILGLGGRRRVVELLDMASFAPDELAVGAIERLAVEQAISSALADLVRGAPLGVCFTAGHGEAPLQGGDRPGLERLIAALEADAMTTARVVAAALPATCKVVVVAGPDVALPPDLVLALDRHVASGGGLLVLSDGAPNGLELVLARAGIALVAGDGPTANAFDLPGAVRVTEGYGDHPVTGGFEGRRLTLWAAPRRLAPVDGSAADVRPLVTVEESAIAMASTIPGGGRVAVVGSAASLVGAIAAGAPANVELGRRLIGWLGGREPVIVAPAKTPEHLRLVMSKPQLATVFGISVVVLPALALLAGVLVAWRRRRG